MLLNFAVSRTADSASEMQVRVGGAGQARRRLDRRGYVCWVLVRHGMESGTPTTTSLPSLVFEQLVYAVFAHDSYVHCRKGRKSQTLSLLQPYSLYLRRYQASDCSYTFLSRSLGKIV